jgi:lipopolysaccharide export system permease protein
VPILTGGVSSWRLLVPYLISASMLAVMSFVLANFIIPEANKNRIAFENQYIEESSRSRGRDMHVQLKPGVTAYVENFNERTLIGTKFSLMSMDKGAMKSKLTARYASYDSTGGKWVLQEYFLRRIVNGKEFIEQGPLLDTVINLRPGDFRFNIKSLETMGFAQLRQFIEDEKVKGSESLAFYEIEKHRRLAYPYSTIVLTLIGMSLSSRKMRGGLGAYLVFGLALAFSYIFFTKIAETFGTSGTLDPGFSVWIPNILYSLIAVYLLIKAPK